MTMPKAPSAAPGSAAHPATSARVLTRLDADGMLNVHVAETEVGTVAPDEVVLRIDAAPINPSDIGHMFGAADMRGARSVLRDGRKTLVAPVPSAALARMALRIGTSLPCGSEAAGQVVAAGDSGEARALLGRTVAVIGTGMYARYRRVRAADCLVLPPGTSAEEGASSFVNPLTALGFVETARMYGHAAMVHTAAASNLGRMLDRLCRKEGIPLVNIVRGTEPARLLRAGGAGIVLDSSAPGFLPALTDAVAATGATIGFDAIGGGRMAGDILACMESALNRNAAEFDRFGSRTTKRMFVYGGLDGGAIELPPSMGKAWTVSGWLLTSFLEEIGQARVAELKAQVAADIRTVFASHYARSLSLQGMLDVQEVAGYLERKTGAKYLVRPQA